MARFQTLGDIDVRGKRVLLRADLNVPVMNGVVTDATRIERLAPTIETLIEKGAKRSPSRQTALAKKPNGSSRRFGPAKSPF